MEYWEKTKHECDNSIEKEIFNSSKETQYQRDRARIIHSASFRRLQSKTQVLGIGDGDFYRTRLTHSLEVAQIGSGICESLKEKYKDKEEIIKWIPSLHLIEAIGLCHDIGHPPFGHGGEVALNKAMKNHGGFEGNAQTLRIVSKLGEYSPLNGMDLSRRALLGIIKYPSSYSNLNNSIIENKPPKCYFDEEQDVFDWIFKENITQSDIDEFTRINKEGNKHSKTIHKSFDTSIMELADDISYGIHDLEDALSLKLITINDWKDFVCSRMEEYPKNEIVKKLDWYNENLFSNSNKDRKDAIGKLIKYFISNIKVVENNQFEAPILKYKAILSDENEKVLEILKEFIKNKLIFSPEVQILEFKGQEMITKLFDVLVLNPERLLPESAKIRYRESNDKERVICDHISGMTDNYATKLYHKLFTPSIGSVFDRL